MYRIIIFTFFSARLIAQDVTILDTTAFTVDIDEFVITAQYEPTHYKNANHKVDIISKEQILQRGAVTLDQALVINPAIRIGYDPILGSTIRMRGISSNNVAILIDGVPVIGRLDGNIDLSQINMQNIERVEIVQGALSNIYGSNAAGGVINLISKKSQLKSVTADLGSQIESIGQQNYTANLGYNVSDFTFNLHGRYFNFNQYPVDSLRIIERVPLEDNESVFLAKYPFNPKKQIGAGGYVRYNINDASSIILKYDYNVEDVPDYGVIKRVQFNPYADDRFYKTVRSDYSLNYKNDWGNTFIDITSAYNSFDRTYDDKRFYIETSTFDPLLQSSDSTRFNTFFNRSIISHRFNDKLRAISGVNYTNEKGSGDRILDRSSADSTVAQFTEVAPFLELNYKFSKQLHIMASGRYTIHSSYANRLTPSVLLKYKINDKWMLRAGYSQGYRSPALKELYLEFIDVNHNITGNLNLTPELSHDYQLTLDYEANRDISLSLNVYRTKIIDRIGLLEYETLKFVYDNIDEYNVFGFQPEINYNFNNRIRFTSGASFSYWSTNVDSEVAPAYGNVIDWNNSIEYNIEKANLKLLLNHRHTGQQPIYRLSNDEVQVSTVQSFELIDLSLNKSFLSKKLALTVGVRNLLGVTNTSIIGASTGAIHETAGRNAVDIGRSAFVSFNYSL